MTRSTRLATLRVAALSLALASVATGASAAGLFDFLRGSNEGTQNTDVPESVARANYNPTPGSKSDNAPLDLNTALTKAQLSRKMGDFAEATKILSQLVLFAPDDSRVMGEYGKTLAAQGKSDDALAFLDRAIQIRPDDWTFYSAAGVAYDQKGQYRQAQESYSRALLLKPGEPSVLNNAALSYMQAGDVDTAEQMIRQAAATSTDKSRIEYTIALVERAKASRPQRSAPIPAPAPIAEPAPLVVASVAPAPEPPQATYTPEPPPAEPTTNYDAPAIESSALPPLEEPVEDWVDVTPEVAAPEIEIPSTSLASLQSNPTVMMQAVPKDDLAGPVQQRAEPKPQATPATPPAPKPVAQTPPARRQLSVSANPPLTTTTTQVAQAAPAPKADVVHTYYVQAGAFATEERADKLAQSLDMMGARVSPTTVGGKSLYRVRIGPFKDAQQASDALDVAKSLGHTDVKVVTE